MAKLIDICNKVIFFLDSLEECGALFLPEWNLRKFVKAKLMQLLRFRNINWKQRHTVNRIQYGDECTKYFHGMATMNYRENSIPQLLDSSGSFVSDHESKASLIWSVFRNRMGVTSSPVMHFNLSDLIDRHVDLSSLVLPFTEEEIDAVVKLMPSDKAPGPGGFNGMFMKKSWSTIKHDVY